MHSGLFVVNTFFSAYDDRKVSVTCLGHVAQLFKFPTNYLVLTVSGSVDVGSKPMLRMAFFGSFSLTGHLQVDSSARCCNSEAPHDPSRELLHT